MANANYIPDELIMSMVDRIRDNHMDISDDFLMRAIRSVSSTNQDEICIKRMRSNKRIIIIEP